MAYFSLAGVQIGATMTVTATAYDACMECCNKIDGITKSGVIAQAHHTIAVDPAVIPLGSKVFVEGLGIFTAEDIGGAIKGKRIDIFMNTHEEAINFGKKDVKIYLLQDHEPHVPRI
ncbi:MAG: 3D domain-containing protein [Dehalobacterium sp.]|jgi:3D (Asp-Asp-Asp) domain-containing protein